LIFNHCAHEVEGSVQTGVDNIQTTRPDRALSIAQIATGVGIILFWTLFFAVGLAPAAPAPCYFAFEHSFPLPDTFLAIGLMVSAVNTLKNGSWGRSGSLVCAGGLLFLGIVDFAFSVQNGGYTGPLIEALQSGLISGWCVLLAIWIISAYAPRSVTA
jgi:hypothetical protein